MMQRFCMGIMGVMLATSGMLAGCGDLESEALCQPDEEGCVCRDRITGAPCYDSEARDCLCSESDSSYPEEASDYRGEPSAGDFSNSAPADFEPEQEEAFSFLRPKSSQNYVYVANSNQDSVARINGDTLEIVSIEVGDRPTVVQTSKSTDTAVVLNEGSAEVSIIHSDSTGDSVVNLPVREGFNQLVISPGGRYALTYLDYDGASIETDFGKFQDVNLVRLEEGKEAVFNVAVGFHVLEIEFDVAGEKAYVISEDGVSVLTLDEVDTDFDAQPVVVTRDRLEDVLAIDREVEVTPSGKLAVVRTSELQGLNVVQLGTFQGQIVEVPLPSVPTDLDLFKHSNRAIAVLKEVRKVALLDLDLVISAPEQAVRLIDIPEGPLGLATLDESTNSAFLYSVASEEPSLVKLNLETEAQVVWDVRKRVTGLSVSPDSGHAIIFHGIDSAPRSPADSDILIASSWAYSMLNLETGFTKLQTTRSRPGDFVFGDDPQWLFVALDGVSTDVRQVDRVNLMTFRVDSYSLASPPVSLGLLPSSTTPRVYVSQEHPVGRMTFFEVESGDAKTVTGYELNSQVD